MTNLNHIHDAFKYQDDILIWGSLFKITGLNGHCITLVNERQECCTFTHDEFFDVCKIVKRPLSDITKEIDYNGEKFVPWNLLEIDSSIVDFVSFNNQPIIRLVDCEFIYAIDVYNNIIEKLFEWHFDVFGLIPQGLAISMDDLKK